MILYKYLQPSRLDVLENRRIRFTQPADFNDPFEFRPCIDRAASDEFVQAVVEKKFECLVDDQLEKFGALFEAIPKSALKRALLAQKDSMPEVIQLLEPHLIEASSAFFNSFLNKNVGVLCLSEVPDSILMWGHYTDNHQGFVIGFDSDHPFFSMRRSEKDEFGFLRKVKYQMERPQIVLSDTSATPWFETKSDVWAYEKEWRIVRVLSDVTCRIDLSPFPACLFEFPSDAVLEVIIGMRFPSMLLSKLRSIIARFPKATLLKASEHPRDYKLSIDSLS